VSLYLDASAIVPTLVEEAASRAIDARLMAASDALIVSDFASAEVASAISRLVRMKFLAAEHGATLLREFDAWRATATAGVDFQPADFRLADVFVRRFDLGLRAPDALHLAVCRRGDHTLMTVDRRLAAAAEALRVRVESIAGASPTPP